MHTHERGDAVIAGIIIVFLIIIALSLIGISQEYNSPCSDFSNYAAKDIPARCLNYFKESNHGK